MRLLNESEKGLTYSRIIVAEVLTECAECQNKIKQQLVSRSGEDDKEVVNNFVQ